MSAAALQIRSFVAWVPTPLSASDDTFAADATGAALITRRRGQLRVAFIPRRSDMSVAVGGDDIPDLFLGDGAEIDTADFLRNTASGVPIRYDVATAALRVATSIVGMPPVFVYRGDAVTAITSDIHLLLNVPDVRLNFDPVSVVELGQVGHPIEHRTLFRDLTLVESGAQLELDANTGSVTIRSSWELPAASALSWPEFLEAQLTSFTKTMARMDVGDAFLSLTAGLDTRTVFSALAAQNRLLPAATMSGPRMSVDAMTARRLCAAYGVPHHLITFAGDFTAQLPQLIESASLLSGGLASLDQAPEVHLYRQLGSGFRTRLSGNLGNQVGRGGTEGVSVRGAHLPILGSQFQEGIKAVQGREHWLLSRLNDSQRSRLQFILKQETIFTLASNFSIGNHFAAQQTPYASRAVIEALAWRPDDSAGAPSGSKLRMRLRDISHRFFGEPENISFQLKLVRRNGGFAAQCPVNWGWRPSGGVSVTAFARGGATLAGMFARAKGFDSGLVERLAQLHDFRNSRRWLRESLRDYTLDVLRSQRVRDSELFDWNTLQPILDEHFTGGKDHYHTVVYALDLALANQLFARRSAPRVAVPA